MVLSQVRFFSFRAFRVFRGYLFLSLNLFSLCVFASWRFPGFPAFGARRAQI
jgi:hypothetical protein